MKREKSGEQSEEGGGSSLITALAQQSTPSCGWRRSGDAELSGLCQAGPSTQKGGGSQERTYQLTAPRRCCPGCIHPTSPSQCQEEKKQGETREQGLHLSGSTPVEREAEVRRSEAANCSSQKAQAIWATRGCPWQKALSPPTPAEALVGLPQFEPGRQGRSRAGGGSLVPPRAAHGGRHRQCCTAACEGH